MPRRISKPRNPLKKTDEEVRDFISSPNTMVFFFDESRFGLQPSIGRCWARKGVRVSAPVNPNYQNFYVYSGVSPFTGDAFSLFLPWVNTEMMNLYLAEMSAFFPDKQIMLIWDQAGWLKSRSLKVPENIILKPLPAYSPELNPVEKIWQWLKKHVCRNRLFPDMDDLMNTLAEHLANLIPTRFMELCHCSYLLHYKANLVLFGIGFPSWCSRFGKMATTECRKFYHELVVSYVVILSQAKPVSLIRYMSLLVAPSETNRSILAWLPIAKLTFCGGISRIIFCPMILCLDGEVVWSNLDQYTLRRKGSSWQKISR